MHDLADADSSLSKMYSMEYDELTNRLQEARANWKAFSVWYQSRIEATCDANLELDRSVRNEFRVPLQSVERAMICCQEVLQLQGRFVFGLSNPTEVAPEHSTTLTRSDRTSPQAKYIENRKTVRIEADQRYGGVTKREEQDNVENLQQNNNVDRSTALALTEQNFPELGHTLGADMPSDPLKKMSSTKPVRDSEGIIPRTHAKGYKSASKRAKFVPLDHIESVASRPSRNVGKQAPSTKTSKEDIATFSNNRSEHLGGILALKLLPSSEPDSATRWVMCNSYFGAIISITCSNKRLYVQYRSYSSAKNFGELLRRGRLRGSYQIFHMKLTEVRSEIQVPALSQHAKQTRIVILNIGQQELSPTDTLALLAEFIRQMTELSVFLLGFVTNQEIAVSFPSICDAVKLIQKLNAGITEGVIIRSWSYGPDPSSLDFEDGMMACKVVSVIGSGNRDPYEEHFKRIVYLRRTSPKPPTRTKLDPAGEEFIPGTAKLPETRENDVVRRGARWLDGSDEYSPLRRGSFEADLVSGTTCPELKDLSQSSHATTVSQDALMSEDISSGSASGQRIDDLTISTGCDRLDVILATDVLETDNQEVVDETRGPECSVLEQKSNSGGKSESQAVFGEVAVETEASLMFVENGVYKDTSLEHESVRMSHDGSTEGAQRYLDETMFEVQVDASSVQPISKSMSAPLVGEDDQVMRTSELAIDNCGDKNDPAIRHTTDGDVMTSNFGEENRPGTDESLHGESRLSEALGNPSSTTNFCSESSEPPGTQAMKQIHGKADGAPEAAPRNPGTAMVSRVSEIVSPQKKSLLGKWFPAKRKKQKKSSNQSARKVQCAGSQPSA